MVLKYDNLHDLWTRNNSRFNLKTTRVCGVGSSERGVYGLTRIFSPLPTCHSVVVYAHSVDA